jgi:hypothetical protein
MWKRTAKSDPEKCNEQEAGDIASMRGLQPPLLALPTDEGGQEPRNAGGHHLETGPSFQLTSKNRGTTVLHPRETEFCKQGMHTDMGFSLEPADT